MIVILSIDVGSSSIRCSAYQVEPREKNTYRPPKLQLIKDCCAIRKGSTVRPGNGAIILRRPDSDTNTGTSSNSNSNSNDSCATEKKEISLFDDIDSCIDETLQKLRRTQKKAFQVSGIGITTFAMNLIGVRADGSLCESESHTLSYACNGENVRRQCEELKMKLGTQRLEAMYQRTGAPLHNAFALAQLRELHGNGIGTGGSEEKSDTDIGVARWLTIASICIARWTSTDLLSMPISYSEASWTGMFQFRSCKWDGECVGLLPDEAKKALPDVKSFYSCDFHLSSNDITKDWVELFSGDLTTCEGGGCQILLGFGDGVCANVGSKCTSPDRIAVTIGTSAAARVCIPLPIVDPNPNKKQKVTISSSSSSSRSKSPCDWEIPAGLFCYRFDDATVLLGGALTDGGSIIAWLRDLLNLSKDEEYFKCQDAVNASYMTLGVETAPVSLGRKLTMAPFLSGERSTGYRGGATGCIMGLTRETRSSDLLQGAMESVVLRINAILSLIKDGAASATNYSHACTSGTSKVCILASGNALEKNNLWRQMLADCSGLPVILDGDTQEGTSRGAALLVAKAIQSKNRDGPMNESLNVQSELASNTDLQDYWEHNKNDQEQFIEKVSPLWSSGPP